MPLSARKQFPGTVRAVRHMRICGCVMLCVASVIPARFAGAAQVTVSAAVSLKEALTQIADGYATQTGDKVALNFAATGHLLAQIREGAPVDVFIAASDQQMEQAEAQDLVDRHTRTVIAGNRLVLIVPKDAAVKIPSFQDLSDPRVKRLAIGQPRTVPAGQYAAQVLKHLRLEPALEARMVYGASVRQVLDYVERGEVEAGIVYATDARQAGDAVRVTATADASWHDPIRYVAAVVKASRNPAPSQRFVAFLTTDPLARDALTSRGFIPPASSPASSPAVSPASSPTSSPAASPSSASPSSAPAR